MRPIAARQIGADSECYFLNPHTLFDRRKYQSKGKLKEDFPQFSVRVSEAGGNIDLELKRIDSQRVGGNSDVKIFGLRKYLPGYETLHLRARIADASDIFHAWIAIEDALTRRSQFFTLIDIYGHYANRGDTVNILGNWKLAKGSDLLNAVNYFSVTGQCGDFVDEQMIQVALGLTKRSLASTINSMRKIRFDIRSLLTHPIIGKDRIICTYPFPLLSPRALVESRARLNPRSNREEQLPLLEAV